VRPGEPMAWQAPRLAATAQTPCRQGSGHPETRQGLKFVLGVRGEDSLFACDQRSYVNTLLPKPGWKHRRSARRPGTQRGLLSRNFPSVMAREMAAIDSYLSQVAVACIVHHAIPRIDIDDRQGVGRNLRIADRMHAPHGFRSETTLRSLQAGGKKQRGEKAREADAGQ